MKETNYDEETTRKKLWLIEQEILDVFDEVCEKNNLKYSLAYGTLLGAVRHKGFIPWDDDIDVMMPREDYEKLLRIWDNEVSDEYIIQYYKKDRDYINNFAKIRKNNTTFLQYKDEQNKKYHKGIFIDIFPVDKVAPNRFSKLLQYIACAINLLSIKNYSSGKNGIYAIIEKLILIFNGKFQREIVLFSEKIITHWNSKKTKECFSCCTIKTCKVYYSNDIFDHLHKIIFNKREYYAFDTYDKVLKEYYGNYKILPPKEKRKWTHHPLLIDFEKNYEEASKEYEL